MSWDIFITIYFSDHSGAKNFLLFLYLLYSSLSALNSYVLAKVWHWKAKINVYDLIRELQDEDVNDNSDDESQGQNASRSQMHDSVQQSHHVRYAYRVYTLSFICSISFYFIS